MYSKNEHKVDEMSVEFQEYMALIQKAYRPDTTELAKKIIIILDGCTVSEARIVSHVVREGVLCFSKVNASMIKRQQCNSKSISQEEYLMSESQEISKEFQEHINVIQEAYGKDTANYAKKIILALDGCTVSEARTILGIAEQGVSRFSKVNVSKIKK